MPILTFDDGKGACTLPPFNAVSNQLFFFRVNAFEIDLPIANQPSSSGVFSGFSGKVRLGVPITDLFPNLMPEYGAAFQDVNRLNVRLDRSVFMPASTPNRYFDVGQTGDATSTDLDLGSVTIGGKKIALSKEAIKDLRAGRPATIIQDRAVVRVRPPASAALDFTSLHRPTGILGFATRPASGSISGVTTPDQLNAAQYNELCDLLFENIFTNNFSWVATLGYSERAGLETLCRNDPRFPAWDNTHPGKYGLEPPCYEIGFVSEYEQRWDLTGYSRGSLVSSITLAPAEELTIEVFTWDRAKLEQEDDQSSETERSVESSALARLSGQVNNDLTETTDKSGKVGLGVPLPVQGVKADGQVNVSDSLMQGIKTTVDTINESTVKASERFKTTTQIKVAQSRETGNETRVTRKLSNPNRGRTLTMHCFEVMEHYTVTTRLLRADKFVLLVEIPQPKSFDKSFVLANEEKLQRSLLGPNFLPGFDAAKKLLAQQFFDERSRIKAEIEAAQAKARADTAPPTDDPPIVAVAKQMLSILNKMTKIDLISEIGTLANSYRPGNTISDSARAKANDALGLYNFWLKFKLVAPGVDSKAQLFLAIPPLPTPKQAYEGLMSFTTGLDDEWLTTVKMVAANVVAAQLAFTILPVFPWLAPVLLELALIDNNLGLPALIDKAKQTVRAYEATLQVPPPPSANGGDNAQTKAFPPPQLFTLAELSLADAEFKKLQLHLEANRVFYLNSLFAQLDANIRYETLKALGLHNFVENRLLGFIGSRAIFPLIRQALEADARQYLDETLTKNLQQLLDSNVTAVTEEVVLPTSGLHMEPVLGQCDALEPYMHERRAIDLKMRWAAAQRAEAEAEQQAQEVNRLKARLAQNPPKLGSPFASDTTTAPSTIDTVDTTDGTDG
jgi:hypothetical protein